MSEINDLIEALRRLREIVDWAPRNSSGIEVTQSIQYFRSISHLADRNDRQPDNSVDLVAYKPAVVRAYLKPKFPATVGEPIGGTLLVERRIVRLGPEGIWDTVTTLTPWLLPRARPLDDEYRAERGRFGSSLNFRIPAEDFFGTLRLTLQLDTGETSAVTVSASLLQTLRVRAVQVAYQGPPSAFPPAGPPPANLNLPAPTLGDLATTASLAFQMMPVQQTGSFATAGTLTWNLPLDDPRGSTGGCSANWNALLTRLHAMVLNDGNRADVVYYGLLPPGIQLDVPGCGLSGIGAGPAGVTDTFVHEIGHGYGFDHAPAGAAGKTDIHYPVYEPYPSASIGEFGVNIGGGQVFSPATTTDYMSYGRNTWMSLYQHRRLVNHRRLAPGYIAERDPLGHVLDPVEPRRWWVPDPWWVTTRGERERYRMDPLISVRGFIDEAGKVRVDAVARVRANAVLTGSELAWTAQLIGKSGEVAARTRMMRVVQQGCGGGCGCGCDGSSEGGGQDPNRLPLDFHAMIADVELGSALRILDSDGQEVWSRKAPEDPVRFSDMSAGLVSHGATLAFTWKLNKTEAEAEWPLDVWAQYSTDDAETWHGLTVGLRNGKAEVDIAHVLPAGPVPVRLLAHDGFSTAASHPVKIPVPARAPCPAILFPAEGARLLAHAGYEAYGTAVYTGGMPVEEGSLEWLLDGVLVGRGIRTPTMSASPGGHKLTLRVHADPGAEVTAEVTVSFEAIPADD